MAGNEQEIDSTAQFKLCDNTDFFKKSFKI